MYRNPSRHNFVWINIVCDQSGLGDAIARMPAIKYILDHHPHVGIHLWVQEFFVPIAKRIFGKNSRIVIRSYMTEKEKFKPEQFSKMFSSHKHSNLAYHMTDHAFNIICNKQIVDSKLKNYVNMSLVGLTFPNLPEKYVVIPPNYTSPTRIMLGKTFNAIKSYVKEKGYEVVVLGSGNMVANDKDIIKSSSDNACDFSDTIDLRDKTTLEEAAYIMSKAKFVLGLDNGLLHLAATCSDVPIVFGFTTVVPETRLPYRHDVLGWNCYSVVIPPAELACTGCQSNFVFSLTSMRGTPLDFRSCFYEDFKCLQMLDFNKYKVAIDQII